MLKRCRQSRNCSPWRPAIKTPAAGRCKRLPGPRSETYFALEEHMDTLGIGIVGAGQIFEQHAISFNSLGGRARLLAIADIDEARLQKAAARHAIPFACADYRRILERKDIDLVTVCTPPVLHERVVADALEAGKFVVCEKPLAHTLESADRIIAIAKRHPGKLSTVYQFRYLPEVQRTLWLRDRGRMGNLLFGRFHRFAKFEAPARPAKD